MKEGGDGGAAARLKNRIEIRDLRIAFGNLDQLRERILGTDNIVIDHVDIFYRRLQCFA